MPAVCTCCLSPPFCIADWPHCFPGRINRIRGFAQKACLWLLVKGVGCLIVLLSGVWHIPCINCIQSHLLVLLYDCFSSTAFYFFRTSELVFFFLEISQRPRQHPIWPNPTHSSECSSCVTSTRGHRLG